MQLVTKKLSEIKPYKNNPHVKEGTEEEVLAALEKCDFDIPDGSVLLNNKYIVTRNGDIYRYSNLHRKIEYQKKRHHTNGYLRGVMYQKDVYIHRIIAMCFVDNPNGYKEVNHKDGNKENNCADNLEWCSRSQNNKHAFQTGLRSYEELSRLAKMPKLKSRRFNAEQIHEIRDMASKGITDSKIAAIMGCSRGNIFSIKNRISYKDVI